MNHTDPDGLTLDGCIAAAIAFYAADLIELCIRKNPPPVPRLGSEMCTN